MKIKKTVMSVILVAIPSATLAEEVNKEYSKNNYISAMMADPFFSQSRVALSFKNQWIYLKEEEQNPKEVHSGWGQGIAINYQSGYLFDIIGIDAAYYGAVKLGASDYFTSRGVLYNRDGKNNKSSAAGYSKFGQRNVKIKYNLSDIQLNARWGWQTIKNLGVITNSTRLSPTTYSGWTGSVSHDALTLSGAYIESSMERNSPDKLRFKTNTGNDINHIASGDILWKSNLIDAQYAYGESNNYLRRHILFTKLKPMEKLNIGTQVYLTRALDNYKSMPAAKRDFDNNACHYAFDATWREDSWSSKWGISYTSAKKEGKVGFYPRHMSKNSRGTFTSMAYAGRDYMRDGELMLANTSDYKLNADLTIGFFASIAQFNYRGNQVRTGEISAFSRWNPSHPELKNLSAWVQFGPGWSYKSKGSTPILTDGSYARAHSLASEIIIEYTF